MSSSKKALAAAALVVPVIFLIRNVGRLVDLDAKQAKSEKQFSEHVVELNGKEADGKTFGSQVDEQECVKETLRRTLADADFSRSSSGAFFLRGCLAASRPTPGYCDGVPAFEVSPASPAEAKKSDEWRKSQCVEASPSDRWCPMQFKFVELHCHPLTK